MNALLRLLSLLFLIGCSVVVDARPLVRHIRSTHEFERLLKKHSEETGLPVIVDFYSDGCGPCRMMAPIFKKLASEIGQDKAVFVKVDTNAMYELSSRYGIRSLPTFLFFYNGQKVNEFSGAGEGQLRQYTQGIVERAERENVLLTKDSLVKYYKEKDGSKSEDAVNGVHKKCVDMMKNNKSGLCVGPAATKLAKNLKKKYGDGPVLEKRFKAEEQTPGGESKKSNDSSSTTKSSSSSASNKPNLNLATIEDLKAELEKRIDEALEAQVEEEEDDDAEFEHSWSGPGDFPERVTIIGGGPAGISAAIYAARAGLTPVVVAPPLGGQLQGKGVDVENYPGMHNVTGPAVISSMREQAASFGAVFEMENVVSVDASSRPFKVQTESNVIETHTIIVATGAESNWLNVTGEYEMRGGGVSSCATCDGAAFYQKDVLVIGGGDAAMEDALVLARTSKSVTVIHRRDTFRASKILAQRIIEHPSISIKWNTTVQEILGTSIESASSSDDSEDVDLDNVEVPKKVVSGAVLRDITTGKEERISCDAVFVAIGHTPATSFLDGIVEFEPDHPGYIKTIGRTTKTSVPGIFAAGDVADNMYRQAITSAGSGAAAALDAERWLSEEGLGNEAAEFEAELLAELMADDEGSPKIADGYNAYEDAGGRMTGIRESVGAEL
uniref:Thioredoxin domain-containing protein n=1 Tax=Ditylum brightwellii TaxID=49249 RepID=A0A6V2AN00_9STRA|mmetsp:Transcript_10698/g.14347  ORF Transcript_10698/g.14347 Transcript_10698/m.14347 type:complete len:669 (+) Transcript_10698:190-2196(+)